MKEITPYEFSIKNAQNYLKTSDKFDSDHIDDFRISEVLSIVWLKSKEDILNDILTMEF